MRDLTVIIPPLQSRYRRNRYPTAPHSPRNSATAQEPRVAGGFATPPAAAPPSRRPRHSEFSSSGGFTLTVALVVATFATTVTSCNERNDPTAAGPVVEVLTNSGSTRISVELAVSGEEITRGLMWRSSLPDGAGMLFVFAEDRPRSFWMKNTPLPLDIIFIGSHTADGRQGEASVVSVAADTTPYSQQSLPSQAPARYVLEVNAGFAARHGIGPGSRVKLPPLPQAQIP